jgi:hypothetical protein
MFCEYVPVTCPPGIPSPKYTELELYAPDVPDIIMPVLPLSSVSGELETLEAYVLLVEELNTVFAT